MQLSNPSPELSSDLNPSFEQELLAALARQARRLHFPAAVATGLIAYFASLHNPWSLVLTWYFAALLILALRYHSYQQLSQVVPESMGRVYRAALMQSLLLGVSVLFCRAYSVAELALHTFVLLGLAAGSVAVCVGHRKLMYLYIVPSVLPIGLYWLLGPHNIAPAVAWSILALCVLFIWALFNLGQGVYQHYLSSFTLRHNEQRLNEQLNAALDQAQSASRSKSRFLAAASHDLRQPIHTLTLFCGAMRARPLDSDSRSIAEHMHLAVDSLAGQFNSLLDISKLDARAVEVDRRALNISTQLQRLALEFEPLCAEKSLQLRVDIEADVWASSDSQLLEQLLRNLIGNSIKYTDSGFVELGLKRCGAVVEISIADSGAGIDPALHAEIFKEFYQVDKCERSRAEGLGLGLAIVERVRQLLDIPLELQSQLGQGSCFRLGLPACSPLRPRKPAAKPAAERALAGLDIMVVDDEADTVLAMERLLSSWGCRVRGFEDMQSAERAAGQQPPELLLSDLRLRGIESGLTLASRLQTRQPQLKVLLVSADTDPKKLYRVNRSGFAILFKPLQAEALKQAIVELL